MISKAIRAMMRNDREVRILTLEMHLMNTIAERDYYKTRSAVLQERVSELKKILREDGYVI